MNRKGFTLIELSVVLLIILLVSVIALPTVMHAMSHRQVSQAARLLQGAFAGARDRALIDNEPAGIRLSLDPASLGLRLANGQLDPNQPFAYSQITPLALPAAYSEGEISLYVGKDYTALTLLPCLVAEESVGAWMLVNGRYVFALDSPNSWFWNIQVGDKMQINGTGRWYTVVGPMVLGPGNGNPDMFVNVGTPQASSPLYSQLNSPDGQSIILQREFLFLVNGVDDGEPPSPSDPGGSFKNGWIDEGFDGVDNNNNTLIDEPAEWEIESWGAVIPPNIDVNWDVQRILSVEHQSYLIQRRPAPSSGNTSVTLPTNMVIDLAHSQLPVNQFTGNIDVLVYPNGTVVPQTMYSCPSSIGMSGSFLHFWLAERSDIGVVPPQGEWALFSVFARTGKTVTLLNPDPKTAFATAQRGDPGQ